VYYRGCHLLIWH